jgi:hypothetical protein
MEASYTDREWTNWPFQHRIWQQLMYQTHHRWDYPDMWWLKMKGNKGSEFGDWKETGLQTDIDVGLSVGLVVLGLRGSVKIKTQKLLCSRADMGKGSPCCERREACV